jgi:circadian clock protein KaiB
VSVEGTGPDRPSWVLTLYVRGASPHSMKALEAVRRICDEELPGDVRLEIIDIQDAPGAAVDDDIVAVPTLVRRFPLPLRKLVGDLSDGMRVRRGLDLGPGAGGPAERDSQGPP